MMKRMTASALVLLGAASYGIPASFVKLSYQEGFTPAEVIGCFVSLGAVGLWLLSIPTLMRMEPLSWRTIGVLLFSGTFAGLTSILYNLALHFIPASLAIILLFQFTWMGIMLDWMRSQRAPTRSQWIAISFILIGTILAAGPQTILTAQVSIVGILLGFFSAISYTGFISMSGSVAIHVPPQVRSAILTTGSAMLVLLVFPPQFLVNGALEAGLWKWALLTAIFSVIVPTPLFTKGVPHVGTGMASILGSIELPVVVIMSILILGEKVDEVQWIGVILILAGIVVSEWGWKAGKALLH